MPSQRHLPPTLEKLEALASALAAGNSGQVAVAADLLARLTEHPESARLLCVYDKGEALLTTCLDLAALTSTPSDIRADVLVVLKNVLGVPEGQSLLCRDSLLRPILEAPPQVQQRNEGPDDLDNLVHHAWLSLVLSAVTCTRYGILEGLKDASCLQDAVFELCEHSRDLPACIDGFLILRYLYVQRAQATLGVDEASKLAWLVRRGL